MLIGVDATCWQNRRGYGRHARSLLRAVVGLDRRHRYVFLTDAAGGPDAWPEGVEVRQVRTGAATVEAASAESHRSARDMWRMSRALSAPDFDLVFFPTIYSYVPVYTRAKKVVMIHDVIAEKYPHLTLPRRSARLFWRTKIRLGRWQADALATVSEYSRRGIVEQFGVDGDRVHVVGEAGDPNFRVIPGAHLTPRLAAAGVSGVNRLIVYVGGFNPHKNLETLVNAFARLAGQEAFADARLVLVGEGERDVFHNYFATIRRQVEELGLEDKVIFTGFLPDEDLIVLLNLATVSVLPSLIEGFGLPAVEAAACGCPVIATHESPLPALLKEGGLYFSPTDQKALEDALRRVLTSRELCRQMTQAGLAAVKELTWDRAGRQLLEVFEEVAGDARHRKTLSQEVMTQ